MLILCLFTYMLFFLNITNSRGYYSLGSATECVEMFLVTFGFCTRHVWGDASAREGEGEGVGEEFFFFLF